MKFLPYFTLALSALAIIGCSSAPKVPPLSVYEARIVQINQQCFYVCNNRGQLHDGLLLRGTSIDCHCKELDSAKKAPKVRTTTTTKKENNAEKKEAKTKRVPGASDRETKSKETKVRLQTKGGGSEDPLTEETKKQSSDVR